MSATTDTTTRTAARKLHSLDHAREVLGGIGRSTIMKLIAQGRVRTIKIAGRRMISTEELDRLVREGTGE